MPQGTHTVDLPVNIEAVWQFVQDMNNWAPLVPGYVEHKIINERQSTWSFNGNLGFMKKLVKLKVDIKEWKEPTQVTFHLTGISDNFTGSGYFLAQAIDQNRTRMSGHLDLTAKGMIASIVNQVLVSFVPKTTTELTNAIAAKIIEINK